MLKEISIEITRKCPNRCLHCSSSSTVDCDESIPFEVFESTIKSGMTLGLKTVCLSGGEPFIHKDIVKIINCAYENGLNVFVYTSGITIDRNCKFSGVSESVFKEIRNKVTKLIFNIEAADPLIYNEIMGTQGCLPLLIESIKRARSHEIVTEAHFVPMKLNYGEIDKVINLSAKLGIERVSFLRLVLHGRADENAQQLALDDEEFMALKFKLSEAKEKYGSFIRIGVPLSGKDCSHECEAAKGKLNIRYDGKVFPCEVFKNKKLSSVDSIGADSIYDDSLLEIYRDSRYLDNIRAEMNEYVNESDQENCIGQYLIAKEENKKRSEFDVN